VSCAPADGTAEVQGDRQKLASLVGNLLDNAVRYAPDASAIDVTLREERGAVTLEVSDEGPGIPEELRTRVFESYYRIPGSTGSGSGLGLAIVREVARAHGARVEIREGRGGKGTAVVVAFPAQRAGFRPSHGAQ
jgi:signal transduction histidine kinase